MGKGGQEQSILDDAWSGAVGGFDWLKSVLFGEFADNRSMSAIVADMLVSFVPGVVIITSARDAVAVVLRLAQHPEKREDLMEWIMLSCCMITVALPLAMAAGGVAAAGVGAIVGGIAGSELGAALRAVMLLLIKEAGKLGDMLKFLQKFMHGDLLLFLRSIKFAKYEKALLLAFDKTINKLIKMCKAMRAKLELVEFLGDAKQAIVTLAEWEKKFYAVQRDAARQLPRAMAELDARLLKVIAQVAPKEVHTVMAGVRAEKPLAQAIKVQYVHDVIGQPLLHAGAGKNAAGKPGNASAQSHGTPGGAAPGPNGGGGKPPPKLKADKIEKVVEGPNTKRQETLEVSHASSSPVDIAHAIGADYTKAGRPTGGHSLVGGDVRIVQGTESLPDASGVYNATIQVPDPQNPGSWITKTSNNSTNSMFPKDWDAEKIQTEVNAAWNSSSKVVNGSKWSSFTPSGVKVEGFISPRTTVYPVRQP